MTQLFVVVIVVDDDDDGSIPIRTSYSEKKLESTEWKKTKKNKNKNTYNTLVIDSLA